MTQMAAGNDSNLATLAATAPQGAAPLVGGRVVACNDSQSAEPLAGQVYELSIWHIAAV